MPSERIVFLFDIDNTLFDNDGLTADLRGYLEKVVGQEGQQAYWVLFEKLRSELGYADYLGAIQGLRGEFPRDMRVLTVSRYLLTYPFRDHLFPHALEVLAYVKQWGRAAILSDGDAVFQPWKIGQSGLYDAVDGNVLIYVHKEQKLADVAARYPAERYILVEDKLRILTAVKQVWGDRVTTVFARQGHYAHDPAVLTQNPPADVTIDRLADLMKFDLKALLRTQ